MISVRHDVPRRDVLLGIVRAERLDPGVYPPDFEELLQRLLERRRDELDSSLEHRRKAARDVLRNGRYRPTGRGKPASEYLLRSASHQDYSFPRINPPVDVCNYISLKYVLPISLWDLDRSGARRFTFRLGREGERYVFNEGGQAIDLADLLVGCRVRDGKASTEEPIVNPVKDSLATKTTPETRNVAACIYAPAEAVSIPELTSAATEFAKLLAACGREVDRATTVVEFASAADV